MYQEQLLVRNVFVLDVVSQPRGILQAFRDAQSLDQTRDELVKIKHQRDALGRRILATIEALRASKKVEQSRYGQLAREYLELTIDRSGLDMETIESWTNSMPEVLEGMEIQLKRKKETGSYDAPVELIINCSKAGN